MKRQLLSVLGLCVFSATLLGVSGSNCFAQASLPDGILPPTLPDGILPPTAEGEDAVARTTCVMLSDGSRLIVELDPMTAFRLTSGDEEKEFYPNEFSNITLNRVAGMASVQFKNGETLTGELEFDNLVVDTTWGGQVEIEGDFIMSIRNTDGPDQHGGTPILGGGTTVILGEHGRVIRVEGRVIIRTFVVPPEAPEEVPDDNSEEE